MKSSSPALFAAGSLLWHQAMAADRLFTWNLTNSVMPGTIDKEVILINNQWPPAPIEVYVNDRIILTVNNDALKGVKEGVSMHAHGFHQKNTNQQDGPIGVTQCAIPQGGSQTYIWNADQPGTFWVHSHKAAQYPFGLRSPLIVRDPAAPAYYGYDASSDFVMDVSDSWTDSMANVEAKFKSGVCCLAGSNQNICGLEVPPDGALVHDDLSGSTTYKAIGLGSNKMRVRLINMSATSQFIIFSNDANLVMEIIEVDGVPLKNTNTAKVKSLELHPGQRYSVLVSNSKSFLLYAVVDPAQFSGNTCQDMKKIESKKVRQSSGGLDGQGAGRGGGSRSSNTASMSYNYALTAYAKFDLGTAMPTPYFAPTDYCTSTSKPCYTRNGNSQVHTIVNLPSHASNSSTRLDESWETSGKMAPRVDQAKILYGDESDSTIIRIALTADRDSTKRFGNINGLDFYEPTVPLLLKDAQQDGSCTGPVPGIDQSMDSYYGANNTFGVKYGTKVFLIVQSAPGVHPFHLHGYDFQVLYHSADNGREQGDMPGDLSIKSNNFGAQPFPLRRDTMWIGHGSYSIIAFQANNPGAWFTHCHNDFHSMMGMAATIIVDAPDSADWNSQAVGQAVWNQCGFKTQSGGGFSDWTKQCGTGPDVVKSSGSIAA